MGRCSEAMVGFGSDSEAENTGSYESSSLSDILMQLLCVCVCVCMCVCVCVWVCVLANKFR